MKKKTKKKTASKKKKSTKKRSTLTAAAAQEVVRAIVQEVWLIVGNAVHQLDQAFSFAELLPDHVSFNLSDTKKRLLAEAGSLELTLKDLSEDDETVRKKNNTSK